MIQARLVAPGNQAIHRRTHLQLKRGDLVKVEHGHYWVVERVVYTDLTPEYDDLEFVPYSLYRREENEYGFIASYPVVFADGGVGACCWLRGPDSKLMWSTPSKVDDLLRQAFTTQFFEKVEL